MIYKYDIHGKRLWEAELDIPAELENAYILGYDEVLIIHGHNHGFTLGHYVRNKLIKDIKKFTDIGFFKIEYNQPGATSIKFMRNN
tara:strand:- start:415 stop:672 length:258 start_codon:yes stop_codon:yes gene_type:complete